MNDRTVDYEESTACDACGEEGALDFMGDLLCARCADRANDDAMTRDQHRAALTRALTAQAWAVACCWLEDTGREHIVSPEYHCLEFVERMARLPAPADLAAEILGERS